MCVYFFSRAYSSPSAAPGGGVSEPWHSTWIMLSHKSAVISKLSVTRESLMRSPVLLPVCLHSISHFHIFHLSVSPRLIEGWVGGGLLLGGFFHCRRAPPARLFARRRREQARLKPASGGGRGAGGSKGLEAPRHRSSSVLDVESLLPITEIELVNGADRTSLSLCFKSQPSGDKACWLRRLRR